MLIAIEIAGAIVLTGIYVVGLRTIALNIRDIEMVLTHLLKMERRMTTRNASADVPSTSDGNSPAE
ncbi:hypothetical protein [Nitrobacter winogradskyi]|uniref:Uncharacterized protein n=2 Tax=Nitrobacter winogradskyi TaxID=913 RepID=A0ACC6AFD0_NITWI|nr:hypothetical protein [Nitrobacter winogradskyi]MCP1998228.1 hypothetical protein [Nitrobacter winogradskyi]GEC15184.1 hypothetical protein NWI01_10760 [Nitrobacter winogradskyi]